MAWKKNDPSIGNDPTYLEPRISVAEHKISAIETELPNKVDNSEKGVANGLATLNPEGKVVDADGNEVEGKVKSVNGQTGDVQISIPSKTSELTNDSGYTTFSGDYNDLSNKPTIPSTAEQITITDTSNLFTAANVEGALSELFTNVSDGKNSIATAITDKGVNASGSETFVTLANKIGQIESGKKWAKGETSTNSSAISVTGLDFLPRYIIAMPISSISNSSHAIYNADVSSTAYLSGGIVRNLSGAYVVEFGSFYLNCGSANLFKWVAFE